MYDLNQSICQDMLCMSLDQGGHTHKWQYQTSWGWHHDQVSSDKDERSQNSTFWHLSNAGFHMTSLKLKLQNY